MELFRNLYRTIAALLILTFIALTESAPLLVRVVAWFLMGVCLGPMFHILRRVV